MKKKYKLTVLFLMLISFLSADENLAISTETAVKFNTLCAKCHEGECSGRLSFDIDAKTASSHINRYAPLSSEIQVQEFFDILTHMKKKCIIFFPNVPLDKKKNWSKEELLEYALSSQKGYFIPLGLLKKGEYKLKIDTEVFQRCKVAIISETFEIVLDRYIASKKDIETLSYLIKNSSQYYLRVESRNEFIITSMEQLAN